MRRPPTAHRSLPLRQSRSAAAAGLRLRRRDGSAHPAAFALILAALPAAQALGLAHRIEHAGPAVAAVAAVAVAESPEGHQDAAHDCAALDTAALGGALSAFVPAAPPACFRGTRSAGSNARGAAADAGQRLSLAGPTAVRRVLNTGGAASGACNFHPFGCAARFRAAIPSPATEHR